MELGRTAAAYKLKYGLAKSIPDGLGVELQKSQFSLNVDEATSNSHKKVLTLLVNHFSDTMGKVVTNHLASVELQKATSDSVFNAICEVFDSYQLPWSNLISVLFDSCAVMRGCKSGVEKKIRDLKAPHLLDIDGDACHHIHNCAKKYPVHFYNQTNLPVMFDWNSVDSMKEWGSPNEMSRGFSLRRLLSVLGRVFVLSFIGLLIKQFF
ncbi:hypothetical protein EGW08_004658 [Elysia chlorotica]|uniref:Uncharacterized protein n=1 Tax=Elysia chlorotica TaxID=188477 RepID=A0A433U179_ELYCH|nr:hypothetical protein EGW08_004658 [Elysia chlorotica]